MDSACFDDVTRALSLVARRRGVIAGLSGALLAVLPFAQGNGEAEARNKKKRTAKKKRKKAAAPLPAACAPNCIDRTCGNDGCGGSCGRCDATQTCQGGICVCPAGTKPCDGACIADDACCPICKAGQECLINGSCATVCKPLFACAQGCGCATTVEGASHCHASVATCADIPQVCDSTAECPPGQHCEVTVCNGGENRCTPLCQAT